MDYAVPVSKTTIHFNMQQVTKDIPKKSQQNPEDIILCASDISTSGLFNLESNKKVDEENIRNLDEDSISF